MSNNGRKLSLAIHTASEISEKVWDLRILMAKMSERQKSLFLYMVQGYDELETLLLAKRIGEVAGVVPVVTTNAGQIIKTTALKSLADLKRLSPDSHAALQKLASDHIQLSVGDINFKEPLSDITWFFKMIAPSAAQTVTAIMEDKKVAAQTRLTAANSILDRAGYRQTENIRSSELPVKLILQMPKPVEGEVIKQTKEEQNEIL